MTQKEEEDDDDGRGGFTQKEKKKERNQWDNEDAIRSTDKWTDGLCGGQQEPSAVAGRGRLV